MLDDLVNYLNSRGVIIYLVQVGLKKADITVTMNFFCIACESEVPNMFTNLTGEIPKKLLFLSYKSFIAY